MTMNGSEPLDGLGVWTWIDHLPAQKAAEFARQLESWGYTALWIPEAVGRDPFTTLGFLAAETEEVVLATGIASIYARDAMTMRAARDTLGEMAPGRFLLGLGVSHAPMVTGARGHEYKAPVATMRSYLEKMSTSIYAGPAPASEVPVVLAALREKMLGLAASATKGAHPYFVTPEHTKRAREIMGPGAWLCPEQKVLLDTDASTARQTARQAMQVYIGLPNYVNNLRTLGFEDADFEGGGSDRLVDAIVAWGDENAIADRIAAHREAGANHVCIQPIRPGGEPGADLRVLEAFAPAKG